MTDVNFNRVAPCIGCGVPVQYRTNSRVCCAPCAASRKKESARKAAEKIRRKNGVVQCKGVECPCVACGALYIKASFKTTRCKSCQQSLITIRTRQSSIERGSDEARRNRFNEWSREKRRKDPKVSVSAHMRVLISRGLKGQKAGRSWREFVPYTLEGLMAHLERQFLPGMTWGNKSEWHIDHIVPLVLFQYESPGDLEFQRAWSLSNLRPLWGIENVRKNRTRTHLI